MLQISWYKPKTPSVNTESEDNEAKDEENRVQHFLVKDCISTLKPGRELTIGLKIPLGLSWKFEFNSQISLVHPFPVQLNYSPQLPVENQTELY